MRSFKLSDDLLNMPEYRFVLCGSGHEAWWRSCARSHNLLVQTVAEISRRASAAKEMKAALKAQIAAKRSLESRTADDEVSMPTVVVSRHKDQSESSWTQRVILTDSAQLLKSSCYAHNRFVDIHNSPSITCREYFLRWMQVSCTVCVLHCHNNSNHTLHHQAPVAGRTE